MSHDDERFMRLALSLGRRNLGRTWPNPSVGAVIVAAESGDILAQGVTAPGGRPHAEAVAIERAGAAARGATLYVSLEPCSHHGRSPPCADAIVAAGIARVVSAMDDPNPSVAGRGHARLQEAGVAVEVGLLSDEAARAHRGHVTRMREGRPAIALKLARTADGFAGGGPGDPRLLISGEGGQARTHLARAHADAILIGIETLIADDPRLDVRLPGMEDRSPLPVVLDSRLRTPLASRLVSAARDRPAWIMCGPGADHDREARLIAAGLDVIRAPADANGRPDLGATMRVLGERGLTRVFCEGGPVLADALAVAALPDEICVSTSGRALGRPGHPAIGPRLGRAITDEFVVSSREIAGEDTIEHLERAPCSPGL